MSRFNFSFIAIVFACLSMVACEKEDFTPRTESATTKVSAEETAYEAATMVPNASGAHAAGILAKLNAEPTLAAPNIKVSVVTEAPTHKSLRYLDVLPDMEANESMKSEGVAAMDLDCPYGDCETKIPSLVAHYQKIATAQCVDQFLSITCCADGETTYVVVYIEADCLPAAYR